jgi:hypothetical protein
VATTAAGGCAENTAQSRVKRTHDVEVATSAVPLFVSFKVAAID